MGGAARIIGFLGFISPDMWSHLRHFSFLDMKVIPKPQLLNPKP